MRLKNKVVKVQKLIVRPEPFHYFELTENMDKTSDILSPFQIEQLERRRECLKNLEIAKSDILRITNSLTDSGSILSVTDTPQGTQVVKMINGKNLIKFHYC